MAGRVYTIVGQGTVTSAGGDNDLLYMTAADDKPFRLMGFALGNFSEIGDAQEECVRISVIRLPATVTDGNGSAVTPQTLDKTDTAAGVTAEFNATTVGTTSGTAAVLMEMSWNERGTPYEWWAPEARFAPKCHQADGLVIRLQSTLADDISLTITAWVEEE